MRVKVLDTPWKRAWGFMFRFRPPEPDEVYLFFLPRKGKHEASIHTLFVFFPLGVIWLDEEGKVVDKVQAKPFRPFYAPKAPASFIIEGHPSLLNRWDEGELIKEMQPFLPKEKEIC